MNLTALKDFLNESKIPKTVIAEGLGMKRNSLYKRLSGEVDLTGKEMCQLAIMLRMTEKEIISIFFNDWVRKYEN